MNRVIPECVQGTNVTLASKTQAESMFVLIEMANLSDFGNPVRNGSAPLDLAEYLARALMSFHG